MHHSLLYPAALVTHICGLTLLAGLTVAEWAMTRQVLRLAQTDFVAAASTRRSMARFPMITGIGFLLLILSGVTMMWITNGAFGEQIWFRVKFALLLLIIANGVVFGRRLGRRLKKLLAGTPDLVRLGALESGIHIYYAVQVAFFLTIFILSVFKFN